MDFLQLTKAQKKIIRYPSSIYGTFESEHYFMPPGETNAHDGWVTARFSPHRSQEHILFMGDDPGNIGVFNVRKIHDTTAAINERQLHFFSAHDGAIMDIVGVPQKESQIVSISGDSTIRCWDLSHSVHDRTPITFFGHDRTIRSICFAPDDPNIFVTGARDGQVKIWDMRVSTVKKYDEDCKLATITYQSAHPSSKTEKQSTGNTPKRSKIKHLGSSVTSVIFLDEFHIASASSDIESGIRIWDIRRPTRNNEGQPIRSLKVPSTKQRAYGITCLAVNRFANRLFASCTSSSIHEYSIPTESLTPVNTYSGANIRDFYSQIACSPVSDTLASGTEDQQAILWDLQDQYSYWNDISSPDSIDKRRSLLPRWSLGGHLAKVLNVGWSSQGKYFMTLDESGVRVWTEPRNKEPWRCCDDEDDYPERAHDLGLSYEKAQEYELLGAELATSVFDSFTVSPRKDRSILLSPLGSPQKRGSKRPIVTSPFKPFSAAPRHVRLYRSPIPKMSKLSSSPTSLPLQPTDLTNVGNGYRTPRNRSKNQKNPFYYDHPTENLPNFVYDNFVKKMIGESQNSDKSLSKTSRKRLEDWWEEKAAENMATRNRSRLPSVSEFGESACSKVMTENERIALLSPRKLVLKNKSSTPSTSASSTSVPKTPCKPGTMRPTSRNLFHYFKTNPQ